MLLSRPENRALYADPTRGRIIISHAGKVQIYGGKQLRKTVIIIVVIIILAAALVVFASTSLWTRLSGSGIKSTVTVEIGGEVPPAGAFLHKADEAAEYVSNIHGLDLTRIVDIPLTIMYKGENHEVTLKVVDTTPPSATIRGQSIVTGETIAAEAFVIDIEDATEVSVTYLEPPDFTRPGAQNVTIVLQDQGGNRTEATAQLLVYGIKPSLTVEAGTPSIDPQYFLIGPAGVDQSPTLIDVSLESAVSQSQLAVPGDYDVTVNANGLVFNSIITVADTTPPSATPVNRDLWLGITADPQHFVTNVSDASEYTVRFLTQPDFLAPGTQDVTVILEDVWGNASEVTSTLTVLEDTVPPVLNGVINQTIFKGDTISYRSGVSAIDNVDGEVDFTIDSSAVNAQRAGVYNVTYTASDAAGNAAARTVTITVVEMTYDMVYDLADEVLASIISPDMDPAEKVRRIQRWVNSSITYAGYRDRETLRAAYVGLRTRQGNCFTYYAVSEVLLTRAGIDNMRITRVGGRTNHFWNLVNVGTGWYHYDATPIMSTLNLYMFTSVDAAAYTRRITANTIYTNYYVYDRSLYPPIVGDDELYGDEDAELAEEEEGDLSVTYFPGN